MLSGEKPFRGKSGNAAAEIANKLNDFPSPLRKHNSDVVPEVEDAVMKALIKESADRPQGKSPNASRKPP